MSALRVLVNRVSDQLFTGSCLPSNEDGSISRSDLLDAGQRTLERRRCPNHLLELVPLDDRKAALQGEVEFLQGNLFAAKLLLQCSIFPHHPSPVLKILVSPLVNSGFGFRQPTLPVI